MTNPKSPKRQRTAAFQPTSFGCTISELSVRDVRFPTSKGAHGSDAMHKDPDYSAAYVVLTTDASDSVEGHGLTFTLGRGTELIVGAVNLLKKMVVGRQVDAIFNDFSGFWRELTSESQLRWIGPEKGVIHMAVASVVNALWDLWAKLEGKPLWKLLVDMPAEQLVSTIDFRYITDAITPEEAIAILNDKKDSRGKREAVARNEGIPAYTTSCGWLGYSDDTIRRLCREGIADGWNVFKVKVGADLDDDMRRCAIIREEIGWDRPLMMDANQRWDVEYSIEAMKKLAKYKPVWIEEPTSPDDVLGHATIAKALKPLGIGVATGEQAQNRVIFKQLLQAEAIKFCQIDSCRPGGVNEVLSIILMAAKFGITVCPHAGGVGLCEYVQHLSIWDYICVGKEKEDRVVEFVDHLHEHFKTPCVMRQGHYMAPTAPGYSIEMKEQTLADFSYPDGKMWVGEK